MTASCTPLRDDGERLPSSPDITRVRYRIEPDDEIFAGHYPGFPVFPGVCLVECAHRAIVANATEPLWLAAVESTRFTAPTFPGDTLTVSVRSERTTDGLRCVAEAGTDRGTAAHIRLRYHEGEPE